MGTGPRGQTRPSACFGPSSVLCSVHNTSSLIIFYFDSYSPYRRAYGKCVEYLMAKKMSPEGFQLWPSHPASFPPCREAPRGQDCKPGTGVCAVGGPDGCWDALARQLCPVPATGCSFISLSSRQLCHHLRVADEETEAGEGEEVSQATEQVKSRAKFCSHVCRVQPMPLVGSPWPPRNRRGNRKQVARARPL